MTGTDGLFLIEQQAINMKKTERMHAIDGPTIPYLRFRKRLGQAHAHFYARYFPEQPEEGEQPMVRFRYAEMPPGSIFSAVVASLAGFLLIWIIGAVNSVVTDPGTDAPAFLLAFPAIAAAWLGFEAPTRRLLEGTLAARVSLSLTAIQSIAATALFMLHKGLSDQIERWPHLPAGMSLLGVSDIAWLALLVVALINCSFMVYRYAVAVHEYSLFSSR